MHTATISKWKEEEEEEEQEEKEDEEEPLKLVHNCLIAGDRSLNGLSLSVEREEINSFKTLK